MKVYDVRMERKNDDMVPTFLIFSKKHQDGALSGCSQNDLDKSKITFEPKKLISTGGFG